MTLDHPSLYDDAFPSDDCRKAFEKFNGSRVGQSAEEWGAAKRAFVAGWSALLPYRDELLKIAADMGEPNDPFAAWERLSSSTKRAIRGERGDG